jgi:hypothetical protein
MGSWQLPFLTDKVLCACLDSSTNMLAIESKQESLSSHLVFRSLNFLPSSRHPIFHQYFLW